MELETLVDIGLGNGLFPDWHQAISWTNVDFSFTWEKFHTSTQATIMHNVFENDTFIITATSPRGQ